MTEYLFNVTVWFVLFKTPPLNCVFFYNRQRPKTKSWANLHGCFYCSTGHLLYFTVMKLIMSIDLFFSSLLEVGEFFFFFFTSEILSLWRKEMFLRTESDSRGAVLCGRQGGEI